jgi:hypothetical protein
MILPVDVVHHTQQCYAHQEDSIYTPETHDVQGGAFGWCNLGKGWERDTRSLAYLVVFCEKHMFWRIVSWPSVITQVEIMGV